MIAVSVVTGSANEGHVAGLAIELCIVSVPSNSAYLTIKLGLHILGTMIAVSVGSGKVSSTHNAANASFNLQNPLIALKFSS
jgi:hypothetical protein